MARAFEPTAFENTAFEVGTSSVTVTATDTFSFSDSVARVILLTRAVSDAASFSDSAAAFRLVTVTALDTLSFSDTTSRSIVLNRAASDSLSFSDTVSRLIKLVRAITDTSSFSDSVQRSVILSRALSDSSPFSDSVSRLIVLNRLLSDILAESDSVTASVTGGSSTATDTFTYSDNTFVAVYPVWMNLLPDTNLLDVACQKHYPVSTRLGAIETLLNREATGRSSIIYVPSGQEALRSSFINFLITLRSSTDAEFAFLVSVAQNNRDQRTLG